MLIVSVAGGSCLAQATVMGNVRDSGGVPQMGALVQVLGSNSLEMGHAVTDLAGHFYIPNLQPGNYTVRASATLYLPATHTRLMLRRGMQAQVLFTLHAVFETATWLPPDTRTHAEDVDDWKWTLRSAAHRPILRAVSQGQVVRASSSSQETKRAGTHRLTSIVHGEGGYGTGGDHTIFTLNRTEEDGADVLLRTDFGAAKPASAGSLQAATGYEQRTGLGSDNRMLLVAQGHPEMLTAGSSSGVQMLALYTAHRTRIADLLLLEAGGGAEVIRAGSTGVRTRPFVRVELTPADGWAIGYRLADDPRLQSYADLDTVRRDAPVAATIGGHLELASGRHQELYLARKVGSAGGIRLAVYHDGMRTTSVSGSGVLTSQQIASAARLGAALVADSTTSAFRLLAAGYAADGYTVLWTQPIGHGVTAGVEYADGAALTLHHAVGQAVGDGQSQPDAQVAAAVRALMPERDQAVTISLSTRSETTGTHMRASYRWQPAHLITAINPYGNPDSASFLTIHVKQTVRCGHLLPPGLSLAMDINNLFAQGYEMLGESNALLLAQSPRTIQGGMQFSF
jgi:hypothetical protein